MDQYKTHREHFRMQIDSALLLSARDVARALLATDVEAAPIILGADDNRAALLVSRTKIGVVPMHTFELEGVTFYVGFPPQTAG